MPKPLTISEYWCTQHKKDFADEINRFESQGWETLEYFNTPEGRVVVMYLPESKNFKNQQAYPTELSLSNQAHRGFTKQEIVFKDFLAALISTNIPPFNLSSYDTIPRNISTARDYTEQYFEALEHLNINR